MATDYYFVGQSVASSGGSFLTPMLGPDGTATAPTYSFASATTTGLYRPSANALGITTNGVLRATYGSDGSFAFNGSTGGTSEWFKIVGANTSSNSYAFIAYNSNQSVGFFGITNAMTVEYRGPSFGLSGSSPVIQMIGSGTFRIGSLSGFNGGAIMFPAATTGSLIHTGPSASSGLAFTFNAPASGTDIFEVQANGTAVFDVTTTGIRSTGTGGMIIATANAATSTRTTTSALASAMSGGTVTVGTNLLPAGSIIVGVAVRVNTTITSSLGLITSFKIGDGTDDDRFGNTIALTAGTTTTIANWTITNAPVYTTNTQIVLTPIGDVDFNAGAVRVTVSYISAGAPTS